MIKTTTREEKIKKINDEFEKLDDEQLEQVAGGCLHVVGGRLIIPNVVPNIEPPELKLGSKQCIDNWG